MTDPSELAEQQAAHNEDVSLEDALRVRWCAKGHGRRCSRRTSADQHSFF